VTFGKNRAYRRYGARRDLVKADQSSLSGPEREGVPCGQETAGRGVLEQADGPGQGRRVETSEQADNPTAAPGESPALEVHKVGVAVKRSPPQ
jgi:hypothetical protein